MSEFSSAVLACGGQLESIALNDGNSIDIGWFGSSEPKRVFIHSSNGDPGSAIQLQWIKTNPPNPPQDGAVVIVHALNLRDAQAARRFQLYIAQRLVLADHIVAVGTDQSLGELYSSMSPVAKVDFTTQEFRRGIFSFLLPKRWKRQVLESGKERIEDGVFQAFGTVQSPHADVE